MSEHGPLHFVGVMDTLCDMTRGVVALLRGSFTEALRHNPASPLVVAGGVGAVGAVVRGTYGRRVGRWLNLTGRRPTTVSIALPAVIVGALEVNQQLHAELLAG
ncbi:MAG: DUF2752 domain-containing protein [Acidimicrobiales bacterium]